MNLEPLARKGDISEEEFGRLFHDQLGDAFPRALQVFHQLGTIHSFKVANVFHLCLQKGNLEQALVALETWCEIVKTAPDAITANVDTRLFFDVLYLDLFMQGNDTIGGIGFERANDSSQSGFITLKPL